MNLESYIKKQIPWSKETFGYKGVQDRVDSTIAHIKMELDEAAADPADVEEWADIIILALDAAWRAGATPEEIANTLEQKQKINFARKWGKPNADGVIEHIRFIVYPCKRP